MTQRVITAFFDSRDQASEAIAELVSAGIPRASIRLLPESSDTSASTSSTYNDDDQKGFFESLADLFFPDDDRYTYAEAMSRGSIMVTATVDDSDAEQAEDILERYGTVNIEDRERSWRDEGWTGYAGAMSGEDLAVGGSQRGTARSLERNGEEAIPIVEENLRVGKREVRGGRVKVRSYVIETPVSEQVSLRKESVEVERRPVNRALNAGEDPFRERTIEAEAVSEEAVIGKEARVTGEVVVKKGVEQRTETVSDTVRSTEVEVDDDEMEETRRSASGRRSR